MADDASGQATDAQLFSPALSDGEKALRDSFVSEYLKDFDPFQAALRVGFQSAFAIEWGKRLMGETYVQQQITLLTRRAPADPAAQAEEDRALLENTLREAMQRGPYGGRIQAARVFAEMRGLLKPDTTHDAEQALVDLFKDFAQKVPV